MRTLVLASTSPYRRKLMQQLGLNFVTASPRFAEEIPPGVAPELLVKHLAAGKASSLRDTFPDALIIGADQVFVDARGRLLGKPGSPGRAQAQLRTMAGKSHTFFTGVSLYDSRTDQAQTDYATFSVTLRELTEEEIRTYVRRENPVDCAGSFKIEGLGIALMASMAGEDYTSLIGLPLVKLCDMLRRAGVNIL